MKPKRLSTKNVTLRVWPIKTNPVYITLRGDSYSYLSRSEARSIAEFLIEALKGEEG